MPKLPLYLTIRTREEVTFEGEIESVTAENKRGRFDVLPEHANFISLLDKKLIYRQKGGGEEEIDVPNGVIRVVKNKVNVYLGIKVLEREKEKKKIKGKKEKTA